MEFTAGKWFPEMEDPIFNFYPCQISTLDYPIDDLDFESFSPRNDPVSDSQTIQNLVCAPIESSLERPKKQLKASSWNSCTTDPMNSQSTRSSSPQIISFEKSLNSSQQLYGLKPKTEIEPSSFFGDQTSLEEQLGSAYYGQVSKKSVRGSGRGPLHSHDHVIAERKRREKLSQRFIALSAVVPGLKKMDKASVLGEAIKYLKHMQERVKALEEQAEKKTMESVVFVKKSQVYLDEESSSSDENFEGWSDQPLPEVEARVSGKDVLIRIQCENRKGSVQKILNQLEKLHLNVINSSVFPFGNSTVDVTIVAKVEGELFSMKEVVKNLRQALL